MKERLSSVLVPIYKLFPLIPVVIIAVNFRDFIENGGYLSGVFFLVVWGGIFYLVTRRWRTVYLYGNTLLIYRWWRQIEIPTSQVMGVDASPWWGWSPRTITIRLKSDTEIGDKIIFVPRGFGYFAGSSAERLRRQLNIN